ncbi:acyl carrier protein synthase (ACP-CoA phosphopantetheinyltransferase)(Holo-ACP synthase)(holo-(acyl-carrier-protein) synthase (CoA:apo-(acyl-carrier-protein) pantetheinephosphotransferase)) [Hyphomicrobium sp. GJ21]|jgi:holo-[acyl-carrier protein] synthase|uniref:holo-ACP synthase n=1 Tax=Hyphomicrobium sp. GJ21 TaxID=113574 RepID=UPI000622B966|nr:holo-ACP synthase [Hyphomicrobium sp. GJ21]CEJ89038.1 acyl carrier protein synthase (ACP-CoA phosphopantetheinyltransferase)(Holo-ACP synthase)(holo-(acyl-carrier-protein) synthase (CoA:apo-(acyl-carrier-protein) pantetheinephosphotransferase)) [Hyphomicrobium sp. GJ21]
MILGIGNDLCDIRRIEKSIERFGDRFLLRVFTEEERRKALSRAHPARTFAKRFAAKEAATKALGTGFSNGVYFSDIGVVNAPSGRPTLALTGGAARHLALLTPKGFTARIDVTLTDEYPLAEAFVVISAVPIETPSG